MEPGDVLGLVDLVCNLCTTIHSLVENMKANKESCQQLTQRVKALQDLVFTIKQRGPHQIPATVVNALRELGTTLAFAEVMIIKYSKTKGIKGLLKSNSYEGKFSKINERLTDNFQLLSGALQIEHGNILHKVYETVSGKRQNEEYCNGQAIPTAPMPLPNTISPMPMPIPTAPLPVPNIMPPMQMYGPQITPMPVRCIMSPRLVSILTASMPLLRTPVVISSTIFPRPILRTIAPVQAPVLGTYVVNNSYYP